MDRSGKYQTIEFLNGDEESYHPMDRCDVLSGKKNARTRFAPIASTSRSPSQDFDGDYDAQYVPIKSDDDSPSLVDHNRPSSRDSTFNESETNHDYTTSTVIIPPNKTCQVNKCPVCDKPMRTYYCVKCIQKGVYITVNPPFEDEFSHLRMRPLEPVKPPGNDSENEEENAMNEILNSKLRMLKKKTEALQNLYKEQVIELEVTKELISDASSKLEAKRKEHGQLKQKINVIEAMVTKQKATVVKRKSQIKPLGDLHKQEVCKRAYELRNGLFTIEEFNLIDQNNSFVNLESSPLLMHSGESNHQIDELMAYKIVGEPWLPANGDYSPYSQWVKENTGQEHIPTSVGDLSDKNPAVRMTAGLGYANQFVLNLAQVLEVTLPAKIGLEPFNLGFLDENHFAFNVAKLNLNVIYLCMSQGIDVSLLHTRKTLKNLSLLYDVNICDLGREPHLDFDNEEALSRIVSQLEPSLSLVQEPLLELYAKGHDDSKDDSLDSDWEIPDYSSTRRIEMEMEQSNMSQMSTTSTTSFITNLPMKLFSSWWNPNN